MQVDLAGQVALVSGAAQGIGRAIAARLLEAGARVELIDNDTDALADTTRALGLDEAAHCLDVADRKAVHALVRELAERRGRIDIIAGAAGGVRGQVGRPLEQVSEQDWRAVFDANADGAFWLAQAAAPLMKQAGYGRIVHLASGAGLRPSLTGIQAYTAAKHALVGLTRQLSHELGPHGITVNAVAPGFVLSNPSTERQWQALGAAGQSRLVESIHLRRLGSAENIADAVLFFVSPAAAWVSGQVLSVDGGRS